MATLEKIARMLDPEAWRHGAATNSKQDTRRAVALKRAAKLITVFAPRLAEKDLRIRETARQVIASDQQQIDSHQSTVAAEAALQLLAEHDLKAGALDPDLLRRICAEAIRAHGK